MANHEKANPFNVPGSLFVDTTCIDCGTCFHLGPDIFKEKDDLSVVQQQPSSPDDWARAKRAIVSCPTSSIGVRHPPELFKDVSLELPLPIAPGIFYCGYTARSSFGATPYFIQSPLGNILVDSPRFHPLIVKELEARGGIKWMFLSHQDDVADHKLFAEHFGCQRIIHREDVNSDTKDCEVVLEGTENFELTPDALIIPTPGHTRGHMVMLYQKKFLFTGDHLFYSQEEDALYASRGVSWFSWPEQILSLKKLLHFSFEWIMPGHGGWVHRSSATKAREELSELIRRYERQ